MEAKRTNVLLLIDANSLIHRFFHALPPLTTPAGEPIGAIYGLSNILLKILREESPDYIAAAFDTPEKTFREEEFKEYKIHRPPLAEELLPQIKKAPEVFNLFKIKQFLKPGFEADDLIGSLAEKFKKHPDLKDGKIILLSGDNDLLQLVDDERVLAQIIKTGLKETIIYNEAAVEEKYGLKPQQLPDYKGLIGDVSDNIPGIKNIGPKTAQPLVKEFNNIEGIFENIGLIPEKIAKKIKDQKEIALLSKKLSIIRRDIPIEYSLEDLKTGFLDKKELSKYFEDFGFQSLVKRLNNE